jgi:hypothetical protein
VVSILNKLIFFKKILIDFQGTLFRLYAGSYIFLKQDGKNSHSTGKIIKIYDNDSIEILLYETNFTAVNLTELRRKLIGATFKRDTISANEILFPILHGGSKWKWEQEDSLRNFYKLFLITTKTVKYAGGGGGLIS